MIETSKFADIGCRIADLIFRKKLIRTKGRHFRHAGVVVPLEADAVLYGGVDLFETAAPDPVIIIEVRVPGAARGA